MRYVLSNKTEDLDINMSAFQRCISKYAVIVQGYKNNLDLISLHQIN